MDQEKSKVIWFWASCWFYISGFAAVASVGAALLQYFVAAGFLLIISLSTFVILGAHIYVLRPKRGKDK